MTSKNFHIKALLAFVAFHAINTGCRRLYDQLPQALGQGPNDNDTQLVGAMVWALWMGTLAMAYPSRVIAL